MPKISQLTSAVDVTANDLIQIVDVEDGVMAPSGTNKKATASLLANQLVPLINAGAIDGSKIADSGITSAKIADGTIVNADINTSAAIAGTKVSPNFGSQNIVTTGTISANVGSVISGSSSSDAVRITQTGTGNALVVEDSTNPDSTPTVITATGNVGIGTSSPDASCILDLASTTRGFRPPSMTTAQRDSITSPSAGVMIYNTTIGKLSIHNGSVWEEVTSSYNYDPDALEYLDAVESADGQSLEYSVKVAVDNFVKGCKADGIWSAIKASCILAGARTLSGALIPLKGVAPTNFNFVSGDYDRKLGLTGDGLTKYISSNTAVNSQPQNNIHISGYITRQSTGISAIIAAKNTAGGEADVSLFYNTSVASAPFRLNPSTLVGATGTRTTNESFGFIAATRGNSSSITSRFQNASESISSVSTTPISGDLYIFARNRQDLSSVDQYSNGRISFYSIGDNVDLVALESRVSILMRDLNCSSWVPVQSINLPDGGSGSIPGYGWSVTGITYDPLDNAFWVGNDGRDLEVGGSGLFYPSIIKLSTDGTSILDQIDVTEAFPDNETLQGVAVDSSDNTLWFVATRQDKIRHITKSGSLIGEFSFTDPNGLAYDPVNNNLIVYNQNTNVITVVSKTGSTIRSYPVTGSQGDQLHYDSSSGLLYITSGTNGAKGFVRVYTHSTGAFRQAFAPLPSLLYIEGITIFNNKIYITDNGAFHAGIRSTLQSYNQVV